MKQLFTFRLITLIFVLGICAYEANAQIGDQFIFKWETTSSGQTMNIRTLGEYNYSYKVNWGDGTTDFDLTGDASHVYATAGVYTVRIDGLEFPAMQKSTSTSIKSIEQWGDTPWRTLEEFFMGMSDIKINATDAPNLTQGPSLKGMFQDAENFNDDIGHWDVSDVTNMSEMFAGADAFNGDLSGWNVSSVTNMSGMFAGAELFNGNLSTWNVSKVTDMTSMFSGAVSFNSDISAWNTSNVTNMSFMFNGASAFNQNLPDWNVSKVTDMSYMFSKTVAFNGDLTNWQFSSIQEMNRMFDDATAFNGDVSGWNLASSSAINFQQIFRRATAFNGDVSNWDLSKVTNMLSAFEEASSFNGDVSAWDVSNVENMNDMFKDATAFDGDISQWDFSSATTLKRIFKGATSYTGKGDFSNMSFPATTSLESMFENATSFNGNISGWDVSNITSFSGLFWNASSFNGDLSSWDVSKATNMTGMFRQAASFSSDISGWNVSNVGTFRYMFANAVAFNADLSGWNVSNAASIAYMFNDAILFNSDISLWDVSKVNATGEGFHGVFSGAAAFDQNLGQWNITNASGLIDMLTNSGLSNANYNATLIGWANQELKDGITLGATGLEYCNYGKSARQKLIDEKGWAFDGDVEINDCFPVLVSGKKDSETQLTIIFDADVQTNAGNLTDFVVKDGIGTGFAMQAQADGTAGDSAIVLTVADLSTAIGDLTVGYTNNNNEIRDLTLSELPAITREVFIDTDTKVPLALSVRKDSETQLTLILDEPVQTFGLNPSDFTLVDGGSTSFAVTSQADGTANDNEIVLTVANLSTAEGTLTLNYENNHQEIRDFGRNSLAGFSIIVCPEGFTCNQIEKTLCTDENYTLNGGTVINNPQEPILYDTVGTVITQYKFIVDESINCCPTGYNCAEIDVNSCEFPYVSPLGNTAFEPGYVVDQDETNLIKNIYTVTFDRAEITSDVFQNATIAESGSVTYTANTNATGVLSFDRSQQHWVNLNALQDDLNGKSRSAFMWVKAESNTTTNQTLFAVNASNGDNLSFLWIDDDADNLEVNRGGTTNESASYNMGGDVWHYVGWTYDHTSGETVVYVDGIENDRFTTGTAVPNSTAQYSLGQEFDGSSISDLYNGSMAEISVWDEVLSGSDIRKAMQHKITNAHPKYAHLVGYYSVFGECDDDVAVLKDHSGKGNNGVMMNGFTQNFQNVQNIEGFNAIDWYENLSWKKDGAEVSTASTFTTAVAAGNYEFTVTRNFVQSSDSWTMTLNSNATTVDNIADETLCTDDPITRTVSTSAVNYLDFEETEDNYVQLNALTDDVAGKSRSVFMWYYKESGVASGDFDEILVFQDADVDNLSRFYIRDTESLALSDGVNDRLNSATLNNETWYFIGYTYDHSTGEAKLYLNGNEEDSGTLDMPLGDGWMATLGAKFNDNGPEDFTDGRMAEITVWDKALTQEEVTSLMGAAPAYNTANLVAAYGTLPGIADNQLRDLTGNGHDGLASNNTIIVSDQEETLTGYNASASYTFSWKKGETEFDTDTTGNITIEEGTTAYSVTYGTPLFQKTDAFNLSYTNLIPTQPVSKTVGVTGSVTFEVDEIEGASYQWYERNDEWTNIGSEQNGFAASNSIRSFFKDGDKLFVGTSTGGLSISNDNGANWTTITSGQNGFAENNLVKSLFVEGNIVYAGTFTGGISISNDGGTNWSTTISGQNGFADGNNVQSVYVANGKVYAATNGGLSVSDDGGVSWTTTTSGQNGFPATQNVRSVYVEADKVYASTSEGLAISNNGGASWTTITSGQNGFANSKNVQPVYANGDNVYVGTFEGLSISNDGGVSWSTITSDQNGFASDHFVLSVYADGDMVYAGTSAGGLSISADGGATWSTITSGQNGFGLGSINTVYAEGNKVYAGTHGSGLSILQDKLLLTDEENTSITNQIQGATTHQLTINNLSLDQNATEYFVEVVFGDCTQASDDVMLTVLDVPVVTTYTPANGSTDIATDTQLSMVFSKNISKGTGELKIFNYSTDALVQTYTADDLTINGSTVSITSGVSLDNSSQYYITLDADLVKDNSNAGNLAMTDKDAWSFHTVCETLILSQPQDQSGIVGGSATFSVPEVAGASYQWFEKKDRTEELNEFTGLTITDVYVTHSKIHVITGQEVLHTSIDRGNTFTANPNIPKPIHVIENEGVIYVATSQTGLYISTDGGATFSNKNKANNGLASDALHRVHVHNGVIYASTNAGLSISTDNGESFITRTVSDGLGSNSVYDVHVDGNTIYAATSTGGLSISTDGGQTFVNKGASDGLTTAISELVVAPDGTIYVGGNSVFLSKDGGSSFSELPTANQFVTVIVRDLEIEGSTVYINVRSTTTGAGIYSTADRGETLTTISQLGLGGYNERSMHVLNGQVYAGGVGGTLVRHSTTTPAADATDVQADNYVSGSTSASLTISNLTEDVDQTEYFVVVTKGDCEETSETATLTISACEPLITTQPTDQSGLAGTSVTFSIPEVSGASYQWGRKINEVIPEAINTTTGASLPRDFLQSSHAADGTLLVGTSAGLGILRAGSTEWEIVNTTTSTSFPDDDVEDVFYDNGTIYAATNRGGVAILREGATEWEVIDRNTGNGFPDLGANNATTFVSVIDGDLYVGTFSWGLMILRAGETEWEQHHARGTGSATTNFPSNNVRDVFVQEGTMYVATIGGLAILRSGATEWEVHNADSGNNYPNSSTSSVFVSDGVVYAGTSGGLAILRIGASDWEVNDTSTGNNFPNNNANVGALYVLNGTIYYAGGNAGLGILRQGATEWEVITETSSNPIPDNSVRKIHLSDNVIYLSTGNGIGAIPLIETLESNTQVGTDNQFTGADTNSLTISSITQELDQSEYFVVVTKGDCEETSDIATLIISEPLAPLEISNSYPSATRDAKIDFAHFRFFFGEAVEMGTGTLTIYKASDNAVFQSFDATDFSLSNSDRTVSVALSQDYELGVAYYVQYPQGFIRNVAGTKALTAVDDNTSFTFNGEIIQPSIIQSFFPATGSNTYVADSGDDFVLYTSESVSPARDLLGTVRVYKASNNELVKTFELDGENDRDLDYPDDDTEIRFEFDTDELEAGTEYYVLIDDGFIVSYENEHFHQGISDPNTWRFTTLAVPTTPTLISTTPADDATDVAVSTNIELTYSENVQANPDAVNNVVLYDASNNVVQTFAANTLNFSGSKVTINPTNDLNYNTSYYLLIDNEAFVSNNGVKTGAITDPATISFTTGNQPNTAPVASNVVFSGNLEANKQLTATYDYTDADTDTESGSTLQWFVADDVTGANRTAISGATASTFTLTSSEVGKFITFGVTPNDGTDVGTRVLAAYDGPVVAAVIPTLISTSPADGAVDVAKDGNLSFVLSESVTKGTGNITLTPVTGTATVIDVTSNEVAVSGTNVTVNPASDLLEGQFYTVTFDATAFVDTDGNNSAGLTSQTTWNFTTKEAQVAPVASAVSINRSTVVNAPLEGSYSYSDGNDDPESGSTYKWYRADDASGTNKTAISGATSEDYVAQAADNNKFVSFEVTPNDGNQAGTAVESNFFGPVLVNDGITNIPPAFTSDPVVTILDNVTYSYTITTEDLNAGHVVSLTKTTGPAWLTLTAGVLSGDPAGQVGDHPIVLTADDGNGGTVTQEFTITVEASNTPPSATSVSVDIFLNLNIGMPLSVSYNFIDAENDDDNSRYLWYRSDDNSGTNKVAITGATGKTYNLTSADAGKYISFVVTPNDGKVDGALVESNAVGPVAKKRPSLSLADIAKVYGDADFDLSATTNSSGAITYSFNNDQTGAGINSGTVTLGNVGTITVDVSLAEDAEYQARQVKGTITVAKRAIEVTATDASKGVGAADPTLAFTVTNGAIVGSDNVVTVSRDAGESVGTYSMTFTDGTDAGNYEISKVEGTFTINSKAITVTADAASKTYGGADPAFTYNITSGSLNPGDQLNGAITRVAGENVGTYVLQSSLFNPDYQITFVPANLTIGKKNLTATADDKTRFLGEANPELTISYEGFANGDIASDITEPTIATAADVTSAIGTYDITLTGGEASNYNLSLVNGTLSVEQRPFITTWEITSNDVNRSRTFFNTVSGLTYLYDIDWGDGTVETNQSGAATHTYTTADTYTVKISGQFPQIEMSFSRLASVEQWGDIEWKSMESAFVGRSFNMTATDAPDLSQATSMKGMFDRANIGNPDLTGWNVSTITDMSEMFKESNFNGNISNWDVSEVTNMSFMFAQTSNFNGNITGWNTAKVTNMSYLFYFANAFDQAIGSWNVSSVTNMSNMFADAATFNQELNSWDVSKVTTMENMFDNAEQFNGNITSWDVSSVTDMSKMFDDAKAFNQNIGGWNVSNVTEMNAMFNDADAFNQDLNSWNTSKVTTFEAMFQNNDAFNGAIGNWDVSNATRLERMFEDAHVFNQDISSWQPTNAENLTAMFRDARAFNQDIGSWRFPNADRLNQMFYEAAVFNQDISEWETSNITDMSSMFENAEAFNQDVSSWDVSAVTSFGSMFRGTLAFNQDISGWNMSAATGINSMFKNAAVFNQDISNWTFAGGENGLTSMSSVFENATAFDQDLSNWDVSNVTSLYAIFSNSGMSVASYDATLIGWSAQEVKDEVEFGVEGLQYCAGNAARQSLIDDHNWTIENDSQSCAATVTIADVSGNEDDGNITVTLTSDAFVIGGFTVDVSTADGTATAGTDYTAVTAQTITFAGTVGETQTFTINPTADTNVEANETLTVSMSNLVTGANNTVTITDQATVTINDDDHPVVAFATASASNSESTTSSTIEVSLSQASLSTATVDYTVTGTATANTDYTLANGTLTFAAGDVAENISLAIIDDALIEANETVVITLSNPSGASLGTNTTFTYTIENNDAAVTIEDVARSEDGESFLVTATLEGSIAGGFTVDVNTTDGTATTADGDYTALSSHTLTFAGADGEQQTFTVSQASDSKLEANENLTLAMSNLAGTTATVTITDGATLTITNDDAAAVTIADVSGNEGDGAITVTATLDNAVQGGFTVEVNTTDGIATVANNDYTAVTGHTLTFAGTAGETQTFTVTPTDDLIIENDEALTVHLSNLSTSLAVDQFSTLGKNIHLVEGVVEQVFYDPGFVHSVPIWREYVLHICSRSILCEGPYWFCHYIFNGDGEGLGESQPTCIGHLHPNVSVIPIFKIDGPGCVQCTAIDGEFSIMRVTITSNQGIGEGISIVWIE